MIYSKLPKACYDERASSTSVVVNQFKYGIGRLTLPIPHICGVEIPLEWGNSAFKY